MGGVAAGQFTVAKVRVGDIEVEVEAVPVAGTEPTSVLPARVTGNALEAFARAQETIIEVARSTAEMIDKAGKVARPDRLEVEFGLKFSASGGVIVAGVAGEASLKVTLGYDVALSACNRAVRSAAARRYIRGVSASDTAGRVVVTAATGVPDGECWGIWGGCSTVLAADQEYVSGLYGVYL